MPPTLGPSARKSSGEPDAPTYTSLDLNEKSLPRARSARPAVVIGGGHSVLTRQRDKEAQAAADEYPTVDGVVGFTRRVPILSSRVSSPRRTVRGSRRSGCEIACNPTLHLSFSCLQLETLSAPANGWD